MSAVRDAGLGLGVAYSGVRSATVRAGVQSIPRGQAEAAASLGMTQFQILRRIIIPQAVRRMLPEALSQFVSLFKATTDTSGTFVPNKGTGSYHFRARFHSTKDGAASSYTANTTITVS